MVWQACSYVCTYGVFFPDKAAGLKKGTGYIIYICFGALQPTQFKGSTMHINLLLSKF